MSDTCTYYEEGTEIPPFIDPNYEVVAADNNHAGGAMNMPPRMIVMHATAGTNSLAWLTTDPQSAVSAHLLIRKDGHIYRLVPDTVQAWHAGESKFYKYGAIPGGSVNPWALGVELENLNNGSDPYPSAQIEAAALACARWIDHYGDIPIVSHATVAPGRKNDPLGFPWDTFRARVAHYLSIGA